MDKRLELIFEGVRIDTVSGATTIVTRLCEDILEVLASGNPPPSEALRGFAIGLVKAQPNMAPVWGLANTILESPGGRGLQAEIKRLVRHHRTSARAIGRRASRMLEGKIVVTNSFSSAVLAALTKASGVSAPTVRVAESRPKREGLLLADQLVERGVRVEVYADAALGAAIPGADVALVGADAVTHKSVIAKIGISHLMLNAREHGLRRVVLADSSKFAPIGLSFDPRDPREVVEEAHSGVRVVNSYFEEVPLGLVETIVTESEMLSPKSAAAKARKVVLVGELRDVMTA